MYESGDLLLFHFGTMITILKMIDNKNKYHRLLFVPKKKQTKKKNKKPIVNDSDEICRWFIFDSFLWE